MSRLSAKELRNLDSRNPKKNPARRRARADDTNLTAQAAANVIAMQIMLDAKMAAKAEATSQ